MFRAIVQANRNNFIELYQEIDAFLRLERLRPEDKESAKLQVPNLDHVESAIHMTIITDILIPYAGLLERGFVGAFFTGYLPARYEKFVLFHQKLNLAMNHLYTESRRFTPEEEAAINKLLHAHLEEMLTDPALFSAKLGTVAKRINRSLPITRYVVQNNSLGFFMGEAQENNQIRDLQEANRNLQIQLNALQIVVARWNENLGLPNTEPGAAPV